MCGIFGIVAPAKINPIDLQVLVKHAQQRGKDSSGLMLFDRVAYQAHRADYPITRLLPQLDVSNASLVLGHSRLIIQANSPV